MGKKKRDREEKGGIDTDVRSPKVLFMKMNVWNIPIYNPYHIQYYKCKWLLGGILSFRSRFFSGWYRHIHLYLPVSNFILFLCCSYFSHSYCIYSFRLILPFIHTYTSFEWKRKAHIFQLVDNKKYWIELRGKRAQNISSPFQSALKMYFQRISIFHLPTIYI